MRTIIIAFLIVNCGALVAQDQEGVIDLPPGGIVIRVHKYGNITINSSGSGLSMVIVPYSQVPHAGMSFYYACRSVHAEPDLLWTFASTNENYVTIRKKSTERLPSALLTHHYDGKLLKSMNMKEYEYVVKREQTIAP